MSELADLAGAAVAVGTTYAVLAAAVAVAAAATRTLHLAIGTVAAAGLTVSVTLGVVEVTGVPVALAVVAGVAVSAALSALLVPAVLWRRDDPTLVLVGFVVCAGLLDAGLAQVTTRTVRPDLLVVPALGGVGSAVLLSLPLALGLHHVLADRRLGRRIRLAGSSATAASRLGVSVARTRAAAFALAGAAAGLAAVLVAPVVAFGAAQGAALTVRGVAAAGLLGRAGPARALSAGLLLGVADVAGQRVWPEAGGEVAVAAVVLAVLVVRGPDARRAWGRAW